MNQKPLILVVDDNPEVLWSVRLILEASCQVTLANDGSEGLAKAISLKPNLIISDQLMPGLSGMEMARRIRACQDLQRVPIIFISGHPISPGSIIELKNARMDFLLKPFSPEALENKISFWLSPPNTL